MMMVEMRVHMDCAGCESKIKKALQKLEGVDDVDVNIGMQKVTVMGWAEQQKVLRTVRKTGRRAELWPFRHNPEYNHNPEYSHNYETHNYYHQQRQQQEQMVLSQQIFHTPQPASSYNYYVHGYDGDDNFGDYQHPSHSTVFDEQAGAMFSDDNPHACSIM